MDRTKPVSIPPIHFTAEDQLFCQALDRRIAEMRRMLELMRPASTAGALKELRDAFPDIPLADRVRALADQCH